MSANGAPYPAWIYRQSAVLPYRWRDGDLEVLLITSRGGKRWVLPKGIVEPGFAPAASAVKEAAEEAGVSGRAHPEPIGRYRRHKWGGTCDVAIYPMRVDEEREDWPEARRSAMFAYPVNRCTCLTGRSSSASTLARIAIRSAS